MDKTRGLELKVAAAKGKVAWMTMAVAASELAKKVIAVWTYSMHAYIKYTRTHMSAHYVNITCNHTMSLCLHILQIFHERISCM